MNNTIFFFKRIPIFFILSIFLTIPIKVKSQATPDITRVYINGTNIGVSSYTLHEMEMSSLNEITIKLRVEADNSSVKAEDGGDGAWVTINFDEYTSSTDKAYFREGSFNSELKYGEYYGTVGSDHPDSYLNSCVAEFELKEGKKWSTIGYKNMEVKFRPKSYGRFIIYYRAAMRDGGDTKRDPKYTTGYKDAFGYFANRIVLDIKKTGQTRLRSNFA